MSLLNAIDEISIRIQTLRRILRCVGLYPRKNEAQTTDVASFLNGKLEGH